MFTGKIGNITCSVNSVMQDEQKLLDRLVGFVGEVTDRVNVPEITMQSCEIIELCLEYFSAEEIDNAA